MTRGRSPAAVLADLNARGGYAMSLVCTDEGLLIDSSGELLSSEEIAGFTSLFDDIVTRAERDLDVRCVDEVTLLDPRRGRLIFRPIRLESGQRFFLVVQAPTNATWRRNTSEACTSLVTLLEDAVG